MGIQFDMSDGGMKSRKLLYAVGTSAGILIAGIMSALWPAFRSGLDTVIGGLLGALALYSGANVSNKLVVGKFASSLSQASEEQPDVDSDEQPAKGKK